MRSLVSRLATVDVATLISCAMDEFSSPESYTAQRWQAFHQGSSREEIVRIIPAHPCVLHHNR